MIVRFRGFGRATHVAAAAGVRPRSGSVPSTAIVGRVDGSAGPGSFADMPVTDDGETVTFAVGDYVGDTENALARRRRELPTERVVVTVGNMEAITQSIIWSRSPRRQCDRGLSLFTGHRTATLCRRRDALRLQWLRPVFYSSRDSIGCRRLNRHVRASTAIAVTPETRRGRNADIDGHITPQ